MGLTRTDGVVLIVCLLAVVFTSRQDGDFALVNTWYHAIDLTGHSYQNGHAPNPSERVYVTPLNHHHQLHVHVQVHECEPMCMCYQ